MKIFINAFFTLLYGFVQGQNCLNRTFGSSVCNSDVGTCRTWSNSACPSLMWFSSHGSPQIIEDNSLAKPYWYGYLWAKHTTTDFGEGFYTPITFTHSRYYTVSLSIRTYPLNSGKVQIYAANNLNPATSCPGAKGGSIPSIASKKLIAEYSSTGDDFANVTFSFYADIDYSQLWIYGLASSPAVQFNANIGSALVCDQCSSPIVINSGVIAAGISRASIFQIGSTAGTGGSGTVSVNLNQNTTLVASGEIDFVPEFSTSVTSGTFWAYIGPCASAAPVPDPIADESVHLPFVISHEADGVGSPSVLATEIGPVNSNNNISVFPTITSGLVNITGNLPGPGNSFVTVFDITGRIFYQSKLTPQAVSKKLDLTSIPTGMYILQIRNTSEVLTRKIQVIK